MTKDEEKERRWNKEMIKDEERRKDKIENEERQWGGCTMYIL